MDEAHLANAVRYVSLNPVRARLARDAGDWRWSSARAHLAEADDELVTVGPVLERYGDFAAFLGRPGDEPGYRRLRQSEMRELPEYAWLATQSAANRSRKWVFPDKRRYTGNFVTRAGKGAWSRPSKPQKTGILAVNSLRGRTGNFFQASREAQLKEQGLHCCDQ